ncbi:MAG TPA: hypothetical protein VE869_10770 [Gemmatimonas sp.]|nr:hypothetical protein [Gemmatimonas sp.]
MAFSHVLTVGLLQAAAAPDTIVARMIPQRDLFDWTSGILQVIVLVLGVGMLVTLILLLLSVRAAVNKAHEAIERLSAETKPLLKRATDIADDAREVVAMVRTDVERVSEAATAVTEQLISAADVTSQRIDEVNAVIDVLQDELEDTAIATVSAIRGARVGARALGDHFIPSRRAGDALVAAGDADDAFDDEFDDELADMDADLEDELRDERRDDGLRTEARPA